MVTVAARRLTQELLADVPGRWVAHVSATEPGLVAGTALLDPAAAPDSAGRWRVLRSDGERVEPGEPIVEVVGSAWELAVAEDHVLGVLGFAGGVAQRARELVAAAPPGLRIVCGGWKKLPAPMKPALRAGLDVAGVGHRLLEGEFVYVAKTAVRMHGGVGPATRAALALDSGPVAVQVTDVAEALASADAGCGVVMVDTGSVRDVEAVVSALRGKVPVAFGGGVTADDLVAVAQAGASIVDIGRAILDAPLWDLHLEVVRRAS